MSNRVRNHLYDRWYSLMSRCYSFACDSFLDYGGRGIQVHEPWHDFEVFKKEINMPKDRSLEIDRIDCNGNYEPGNVRWVNKQINMANRRKWNKNELPRGVRKCPSKKRAGMFYSQIYIQGVNYHLGVFPSAELASQAFNQVFIEWYGFNPQGVK